MTFDTETNAGPGQKSPVASGGSICRATLFSLLCQAVGSFIVHDAYVRPDLDHAHFAKMCGLASSCWTILNAMYMCRCLWHCKPFGLCSPLLIRKMDVRLFVKTYTVRWG